MAVSSAEILSAIGHMSVLDLVKLIENMEKEFNVSAAPVAMAMSMGASAAAPVVEEQTEFNVVMRLKRS
jgi:large subunit ribosomal protein L7/L12